LIYPQILWITLWISARDAEKRLISCGFQQNAKTKSKIFSQ
jgi:hypothetical protein